MATTVKVSKVLISKLKYYSAISVDVVVMRRDSTEINAIAYTIKALVGRILCASA